MAFEGNTRASLIGAILKDEPPPVSRVQPVGPAALDRIISTCLAKDPDDRYQSARDLVRDLTWVASGSSDGASEAPTVTPPARSRRVPWLVAAALAARTDRHRGHRHAPRRRAHAGSRSDAVHHRAAGERVVWRSEPWWHWQRHTAGGVSRWPAHRLRRARPIRVSDLAAADRHAGGDADSGHRRRDVFPFWSPDSRSIGFFADGKLKTVQIAGGPPIVLGDAPSGAAGVGAATT